MYSEYPGVVGELREGRIPLPARLNLLRAGVGESSLRREKIDDAAYSLAIASGCDLNRLLGAGEKLVRRRDPLLGGLQSIVRNENLGNDQLARLVSECRDGVSLRFRRRDVVLMRKPVEDGN